MSTTQCQTAETPLSAFVEYRTGFAGQVGHALVAAFERFALWQDRARQRAHLAALDDHELKDIGITRVDASFESAKPFWRA